jgi:predicted lipid-binding transport protein (Tim44 family)
MLKKCTMLFTALALLFTFVASDYADARPRGGFKSPRKSYTPAPKKSTDNTYRSDSGTTSKSPASGSTAGTAGKRGFFSGGSLMKGLMIGGLAGLLFGGLFGNMGFIGDLLGLMINILALYVLFIVIRNIFRYFSHRRKNNDPDHRRY